MGCSHTPSPPNLLQSPLPPCTAHDCSAKKGAFFAGLVPDENDVWLCEMRGGEKKRRKGRELRVGGLNCPFQGEFLDDGSVRLTPETHFTWKTWNPDLDFCHAAQNPALSSQSLGFTLYLSAHWLCARISSTCLSTISKRH